VTCTKSVYVTIGPIQVHLMRHREITVNNKAIRLPRRYGISDKGDQAVTEEVVVARAGVFVLVSAASRGLTVLWDGGTRVYVRLEPVNRGVVEGLCGDYNGMLIDEYRSQRGSIEINPTDFANSWKLSPSCPSVVSKGVADYQCPHVERLVWSRESCGVIKSAEFEACHALVPSEDYYGRCVYDACSCDVGGDCECLCTAIADYAAECSKKGVSVHWRSNERCPMQCDGGKHYRACGNPCEDSCSSLNSPAPRHCQLIRQRFRSVLFRPLLIFEPLFNYFRD
jgi:hypothetical protein